MTSSGAALPRIATATVVRGAVARLRGGGRSLVGLLAVTAAALLTLRFATGAIPLEPGDLSWLIVVLAGRLGGTLVGSVAQAFALRLFLDPRQDWLRLDAGLAQTVLLLGLGQMAVFGVNALFAPAMAAATGQVETGLRLLSMLTAYAVVLFALLRLTLWPIARLTGRADITARRSWRLMQRATRGLVLADLAMFLPVAAVAVAAYFTVGAEVVVTPLGGAIIATAAAGIAIATQATAATVYAMRVEGAAPDPRTSALADIFD